MSSSAGRPFSPVQLLRVALALFLPSLLGGCVVVAAGAAGAGAVAWVRGELTSTVAHDINDTFGATQRALHDLEFVKISEKKSAIDAELISRTALDKKIEVKLERIGEDLTKIGIRVGVMGDQALSMTILDRIKAELD